MDSWCDCWFVPACHHDWPFPRGYCKQFNSKPHGHWILPYSYRGTVSMGAHSYDWVIQASHLLGRTALTRLFRLFILPDTPRWYIKQDRYEDAANALGKLRRLPLDHPAIVEELNEVQANHAYEMSLGKASYMECFKGTLGKRLATGCLLQALQQLSGVNFICKCGCCNRKCSTDKGQFTTALSTSSELDLGHPSLSRSSSTVSTSFPHFQVYTWLRSLVAVTCYFLELSACACLNVSCILFPHLITEINA